jgi:tetratricopeptide (TPR) repeat protein
MMKLFWKWPAVIAVLGTMAFAQKPKSQKEIDALQAIQNSADADSRLKAIESLLTKFADTEFKVIALEMAVDTARQKGDNDLMIIYCERTLEADPSNLNAISSIAKAMATGIRENDLDKEDKLKRVDELTGKCLKLAPDAKKPTAMLTDDQWNIRRNDFLADCHDAVAQVSIVRKKPDAAIAEFQASLAVRKDPATMVRIAQVYNSQSKYDDAIATLDQVAAMPDVNPIVKQVAGQEKVKAVVAKAKMPKPAVEAPKPQQ